MMKVLFGVQCKESSIEATDETLFFVINSSPFPSNTFFSSSLQL